ncbi:hypothetical protein F511_01722 [Dorcoceras hygrometricum]|uniref:Nuclear pore complex protein NUP1 n=1 Tax=Dorcoceras hygrometricum TaxID=472368 RepID=A0A2Z7ATN5_9LAMI|nr:hypothetical protein F511_01722 [Dorcoceras hygrometricum]
MSTPVINARGILLTNNANPGPSMPSSRSPVQQSENFESKPLALKRKNSVLGDDLGSVGPIRRIRQRPNLLASRTSVTASGLESSSDSVLMSSKQKHTLIVKPKNSVSKTVGETQDDSIPSASYTHVPSRSSEVAARILQHLENLTPKEKSPESKLVKLRDKSPLRLTSSMLGGQALKIKEDVASPQLLLNFQDGRRMEDRHTAILPDTRDSTCQKLGNAGQNSTEDSVMRAELLNPLMKNDIVESLKPPGPSSENVNAFAKNGVAQPPLEEGAFRMIAQEDDGVNCHEIAPGQLGEGKGPSDTPFVDNDASVTKEPMLLKTNSHPKPIFPSGHISNKTTETGSAGPMIELGNGGTIFPPFSAPIKSEVNPHSVDLFSKLKGTKDFPPSSHFGSRSVDKFPSSASESSNRMTVFKSENSSSMVDVLPSATGSELVISKSDQIGLLHPLKSEAANGKYHTVPSTAFNGQIVSSSPAAPLTAVSSCDANQISTASSILFNTSTSTASFASNGNDPSTSATISGNPFGPNVPSVLGGPVATFGGAFINPTTTVSAALTSYDSGLVDLKNKTEESNSGWSSAKHSAVVPFTSAISGRSTPGLDTSSSYSSVHDLQRSPFTGANKFFVSGVETVSKSTSIQSVSSVLVPSSNMNSSISFGTSLSNSQFTQHQTFSSSSSASPSDSIAVASSSDPAKGVFRFGGSSVMTSVPNSTSSSSGGAASIFNFGASSPAPSSVPNIASFFSSGASDIFKVGVSSSAPSSASNLSSNTAPSNVFGSTSPFTGFSFTASSATLAPKSASSPVYTTNPSSSPTFSFAATSQAMSPPPPNIAQPMFGNVPSISAVSPGNGDQMNTDDNMAEDPVQYSTPSIPVFGQPAVSPFPSGVMFGSTAASPATPFSFGGQQNQVTPQNPPLFQGSGGSFSLGSGGGDKSTRKFIKASRTKNRKK